MLSLQRLAKCFDLFPVVTEEDSVLVRAKKEAESIIGMTVADAYAKYGLKYFPMILGNDGEWRLNRQNLRDRVLIAAGYHSDIYLTFELILELSANQYRGYEIIQGIENLRITILG